MPSSGMLRSVAVVSSSIIRVTRIGELGTLAVTSNRRTLIMEALSSSETSDFTRATRDNIPEDAILHSYRRESLKSYILLYGSRLSVTTFRSPSYVLILYHTIRITPSNSVFTMRFVIQDLQVSDDGVLMYVSQFWTLPTALSLTANTTFRRLQSVSVSKWWLFSWVQ
jgi:hypothetical protein